MKLHEVKFNGKIYGKPGAWSIYVNNQKVEVSDEDVAEYKNRVKLYEELDNYHYGKIRINLEWRVENKKALFKASLEQLQQALSELKVTEIFKGQKFDAYWEIIVIDETIYIYGEEKDGKSKTETYPISMLEDIKKQLNIDL